MSGAEFTLWLFTLVLLPLLLGEAQQWLPRLAAWIVRRQAERLPEPLATRFIEEWSAHLEDVPGPLSKLWQAATIAALAAPRIRHEALCPEVPYRPLFTLIRRALGLGGRDRHAWPLLELMYARVAVYQDLLDAGGDASSGLREALAVWETDPALRQAKIEEVIARLRGLVAKMQQTGLGSGSARVLQVLSTSQSAVDSAVAWVRADVQVFSTYVAIGSVTANAQDLEPVRAAAVAAARAAERLRTAIMSDVPVPGILARAHRYLHSRLQRRR